MNLLLKSLLLYFFAIIFFLPAKLYAQKGDVCLCEVLNTNGQKGYCHYETWKTDRYGSACECKSPLARGKIVAETCNSANSAVPANPAPKIVAFPSVSEHMKWVLDHEGKRNEIQNYLNLRNYEAIRQAYNSSQSGGDTHRVDARNQLSQLSNEELKSLLENLGLNLYRTSPRGSQ